MKKIELVEYFENNFTKVVQYIEKKYIKPLFIKIICNQIKIALSSKKMKVKNKNCIKRGKRKRKGIKRKKTRLRTWAQFMCKLNNVCT